LQQALLFIQHGYLDGLVLSNSLSTIQFGILQYRQLSESQVDRQTVQEANELVTALLQPLHALAAAATASTVSTITSTNQSPPSSSSTSIAAKVAVSRELNLLLELLPSCIETLRSLRMQQVRQ
jgi:hypothetical protein